MNAYINLFFWALALSSAHPSDAPISVSGREADVYAFTDVAVVPMDEERVLRGHTVVVRDGRIEVVGPVGEVEIPDDAIRIDGSGRYLMPGLAEMHGHIPPPTSPRSEIENTLFLYLANGITTVRGMLGWPGQLDLRAEVSGGGLDAPNLYLAGPSFNGSTVNSPAQAAARVRAQHQEGWDLLKVHPGLERAEYDSLAVTAKALGIEFGGHVPVPVGLEHALAMGQQTFDHLDGYVEYLRSVNPDKIDEAALEAIVGATIDAGAWVVPTMVLWETILSANDLAELNAFAELIYVSPATVASWDRQHRQRTAAAGFDPEAVADFVDMRMRVLGALNEAGARILMGTDAPQQYSVPGFSLHREMARMEEAGMTPFEVLMSGTRAVGEYFEDWDAFGTVSAGMRADLILLTANPLEDLSHVADRAGVMVRGRWYPEAAIQERLRRVAASYR